MFGATVSTPLPLLLEIPRAAEFREPNAVAFSSLVILVNQVLILKLRSVLLL